MAESETWLDKVRRGEPFEMLDWDFIGAVTRGKANAADYNAAPVADFEKRDELLRRCLGRVGKDAFVQQPITVDLGFNIEIGDGTFINSNCTLLDTYPIRIGDRVQIGPNCAFYPVGHPVKASERSFFTASGEQRSLTMGAPIVVEDDVWMGGNCVVLPGVTIGARSTIGAGSVVTRSVPPDVLAAGNPCRPLRGLV